MAKPAELFNDKINAKQADPGYPKGQPIRKRRTRRPAGPAPGAFLWIFLYAFRSLCWRGLDNLSCLPADYAGKVLLRMRF